jgi:hypothetical protein
MGTLNYQNIDDARPEQRSRLRMKLFGTSRADVWKALATELDARYQDGGFWKGDRVVVDVAPWEIVLDTYTVHTGQVHITYTRMRAPYVNADGFRFSIHRKNIFTGVSKLLGMQDVEIGHGAFDEAFVIRGNDETKLRRLFASPELRALIEAQPSIRLEVKDDEGFFRKSFPDGVDELYFAVAGVIKDIDRLKALYDLFAQTLHELCRMGSAYEREPGVEI